MRATSPAAASYAYAALVAATLGYFLVRIPIQVTDSFLNILALDPPFLALMRETLEDDGYLRPGLWAALKIVYDLSGGDYYTWYRLTHVLQVLALALLFVRLLQPREVSTTALVPLALALLIGSHTFAYTVLEAFPINTFLTVVLCCIAAANLAFARHRWWIDLLAVALFAFAALTVESGLLVWVILAGGFLTGLRGVSRRGIVACTALLAAYFWVRFVWLDVGVPTLLDREAGFGFHRYEGRQLQEMFGANPYGFYAYNVVCSILNTLIAEPRDGTWHLTRSILQGDPEPVLVVHSIASTLATALVCRYVWRRRQAWRALAFDRGDRIVLLFGLVLLANAAMCYAYTKDVIMSPTGVFFAAAVFVASSDLVAGAIAGTRRAFVPAFGVLLVLSTLWGYRAVGIHASLHLTAGEVRDQWAYIDDYLQRRGVRELPPRQLALKRQLQDDAVRRLPTRPGLRNEWARFFGALSR